MRQVNRDELIHILLSPMRLWPISLLREMQHHDPATRLAAKHRAASIQADAMQRLEILSEAPPPAPFRYPAIGVEGYDRDPDPMPSPNPWSTVGEGSRHE